MRKLSLWLPVAVWCALIFALSSIQNLTSGLEYDFPLRKLGHMLEYGVLFALSRRALAGSGSRPASAAWGAAAFCLLYAASDEWHQSFVPGRCGCAGDVAIDSTGVLAWWALSCRAGRREWQERP
ncbi:MAG: VanZ family protein [Elusimicrobiota bacterium]